MSPKYHHQQDTAHTYEPDAKPDALRIHDHIRSASVTLHTGDWYYITQKSKL